MDDESNSFLTQIEAAKLLRLSPRTLENYRCNSKGPPFIKLGARILYTRQGVISWVEKFAKSSKGND